MTMADFFDSYWWLIFPLFGMAMGFWGMLSNERRQRSMMEVMKSYVEQGKEPPAEMMRMMNQNSDESGFGGFAGSATSNKTSDRAWSFIVFAALAAGAAVAYALNPGEDWAWVFLTACVVMAVMAVGALGLLVFSRKS